MNMISHLEYSKDVLTFGQRKIPLDQFTANYQGPVYIYDLQFVRDRASEMKSVMSGAEIYYAMKANSNLELLKVVRESKLGIDVVSRGEIHRALEAGFKAEQIIFSGVGKTILEITEAIQLGIHQINVESLPELERIVSISRALRKRTPVALRINPNIDIKTHPYIATGLHENKFGIDVSFLPQLESILASHPNEILLKGLSLHLGSQMLEFSGFQEALKMLRTIYSRLHARFPSLERFDIGGGLGIYYQEMNLLKESQDLKDYWSIVTKELEGLNAKIQTEPGRWIVAHAGILLTQIQYIKDTNLKTFVIIDAGMSQLLRPALYQAYHSLYPVQLHPQRKIRKFDVVGPICESADFVAKDRRLQDIKENEFLIIADVGAYGFSMSNTYNLQDLPKEICL